MRQKSSSASWQGGAHTETGTKGYTYDTHDGDVLRWKRDRQKQYLGCVLIFVLSGDGGAEGVGKGAQRF